MSILFSIAVHEDEMSIIDLIDNINYYCKDCYIVLHLSKQSKLNLNIEHTNLFINKNQFITGYADGTLSFVHYSNYQYANKNKLKYEYFIPFGSNQLFIKEGVEKYILGYDKSYIPNVSNDNYQLSIYRKDSVMIELLGLNISKSAPEGTFYKKQLIEDFVKNKKVERYFLDSEWLYKKNVGLKIRKVFCFTSKLFYKLDIIKYLPSFIARYSYASEELLFPSIISSGLTKDRFCYIPWHKKDLSVTIDEINECLSNGKYLSVKRIERSYDDPVRKYIREVLSDNYKIKQ
ncbi:hypothetical protein [Photobacterium sp. Alg240-V54]|uniref:hypothetical protein n=1 Tax=Photobacterium sp. Alg240-V54 TaxID=2305995 RepID=UPI0013D3C72C|nr:hypothetical protein [Photobacterium sp. Alg240-V54]